MHADKRIPRGVVGVDLARAPEERVVVPAFPILGLVIDGRTLDFHLADRVGALVVRHVIQRFVEAELDKRKEGELLGLPGLVPHRDLPHFDVLLGRHEHQLFHFKAGLAAGDPRVTQAVAAFKGVERSPRRLPARIPDGPALLHVEEATVVIHRVVVVTIARQAAQPGVLPEGVAAGGLGAEAEKLVLAEHVQPGQGGVGARDHEFAILVVEVAVGSHGRERLPGGAFPAGRDCQVGIPI